MLSSRMPKYLQLSDLIRGRIESGVYAIGSQLPTEMTLCEEHQVSRGTVRQCYDVLEREGLIQREQGRGIFVTSTASNIHQFSLVDSRNLTTKTHQQIVIEANEAIADKLACRVGTPIIHITQTRYNQGQAVLYESRYIAQALCPNLVNDDLDTHSIHRLLIQQYQLSLVRLTHTIDIRPTPSDLAARLGIAAGQPAFFVDRLTFTEREGQVIPAVWYQAVYRQDDFYFQVAFDASI